MSNICPECGTEMPPVHPGREPGVDASTSLSDASGHEQEASHTSSAPPRDGGAAGGALEAAAAHLAGSAGAGGGFGALAATAVQERQLREWAEKTGRLISEEVWLQHEPVCSSSAEHEVRFRAEDDRAIKKTHAGSYGFIPRLEDGHWKQSPASPLEYLRRCLLQNILFCDDIRLEGVCISSGPSLIIGQPAGGISLIISQPWIRAADRQEPHPTEADIAAQMSRLGFEPIPNSFFGWRHAAGDVVLLDAKRDNFILSASGIAPIDVQVTCPPDAFLFDEPTNCSAHVAVIAPRLCPNPDCPTHMRARIRHWCTPEAMAIAHDSADLLDPLVIRGLVVEPSDLYRLRLDELLQFPGVTEASAQRFLDAVEASKSHELARLIFALGIPEVGVVAASALARAFSSLEDLRRASLAQLRDVEGLAEAAARNVVDWFGDPRHRQWLKRLRKAGLNLERTGTA